MLYSADYNEDRLIWEVIAWRIVPNGNRLGIVVDKVETQEQAEEIAATYNDEMATAD